MTSETRQVLAGKPANTPKWGLGEFSGPDTAKAIPAVPSGCHTLRQRLLTQTLSMASLGSVVPAVRR